MSESSPSHAPAPIPLDADNPWPGLEAFREEDAEFFFGRDLVRDELARLVLQHRLVVLHGRSGLGKTSLLRAGVFPCLRDSASFPIYVRLAFRDADAARPNLNLRAQVKAAIERAAAEAEVDVPELDPGATLWEWFYRVDAHFWNERSRRVRPVLVFDQFEEAFTHGRSTPARVEETDRFLDEVVDLVRGSVPRAVAERLERNSAEALSFESGRDACGILLALRQDFLPDLLRLGPRLPTLLTARLELEGMTLADAERVVTGPGGHLVEDGVAARIVDFVAKARRSAVDQTTSDTTVDPAILSVFCRELNRKRQDGHLPRITATLVEGTQDAIIADFYRRSVQDLGADVERFIEEELITESGFRDSIAYDEALRFAGITPKAINTLIERRLLRPEGAGPRLRLELTHDVLLDPIVERRGLRRVREREEGDRRAAEQAREAAQKAEDEGRRERELKNTQVLLDWERQNADLSREMARQRQRSVRRLTALGLILVVVAGVAVALWRREQGARSAAEANLASAHLKQGLGLTAVGNGDQGLAYIARALRTDKDSAPARSLAFAAMLYGNWPLPEATLKHDGRVYWADFDPTGTRVVTVSEDKTARLWTAGDGRLSRTLAHDGAVFLARFGPGGRTLLTVADDGHARAWDVASGLERRRYDHPGSKVTWGALGPREDQVATGAEDGTLRIWSGADRSVAVETHEGPLWDAQFDRTGDRLVTASGNAAAVWDVATGRRLARMVGHRDRVGSAQLSADGQFVATASRDGQAGIWSAKTGQRLFFMRHDRAVVSARFSPDGTRLVTASGDGSARVWDAAKGTLMFALLHDGRVASAFFSRDGSRIVTASADGTARVWSANDGRAVAEPMRHPEPLLSAAISPDGTQVVTTPEDGTARVWDVRPGAAVPATVRLDCSRPLAQFEPHGGRLAIGCGSSGAVSFWDGAAATLTTPLTDPNGPATESLEVGADGTRILIGRREEAALWKMETGEPKLVADLRHEVGTITAARFSLDGTMIVTAGTDNRARTWDARTGAPIASVQHQGEVSSAEFSADSTRIVTGSADRTARVWEARTGAPVGDPLTHPDGVKAAHLDGRGARVLTVAGDGVARLWDLDAGTTVTIRYSQPIVSAGFGRGDETVMTLAYDGTPRLWEAGTGHLIAALADAPSLGCEFSPDGQRLVTSSRDAFRIWDARTGEPRTHAIRHDGGDATAHFSPDGERVVTAAEDGTVRIWNVPVGSREDSHTMASLLEAVVGYAVNDGGSLVPVGDRAAALRERRDHRPPAAAGLGGRVGAWVLADRQRRTISPFTNVTIEEYVRQQLETHDEDARLEVRRRFPWDARSLPSPAAPTPSETEAPPRESPGAGHAPTGGRRRSNVH